MTDAQGSYLCLAVVVWTLYILHCFRINAVEKRVAELENEQ